MSGARTKSERPGTGTCVFLRALEGILFKISGTGRLQINFFIHQSNPAGARKKKFYKDFHSDFSFIQNGNPSEKDFCIPKLFFDSKQFFASPENYFD